jgi:hypothetical protein
MKVLVNGVTTIKIDDPNIRVKDGKLYNIDTQLYEGVQGDAVWFLVDKGGIYLSTKGLVEGYTNGKNIKLIGTKEPLTAYNEYKSIEHVSTVKVVDDEEELLAATMAL